MEFTEQTHPDDPDAVVLTWEHDGHEHFQILPREVLIEGKAWAARHAERVNTACAFRFIVAGGDGNG